MDFDLTSWAMMDFQARNPRFAPKPKRSRKALVVWSLAVLAGAATAAGVFFAPELAATRTQMQTSAGSLLVPPEPATPTP